jgi:hypothetical protein
MALYRRGQIWYADYSADGQRIQESTGTANKREAEKYLALRISEVQRGVFVKPINTTPPQIQTSKDAAGETDGAAKWLDSRVVEDKIHPHEIGVFVRSGAQMDRVRDAIVRAGLKPKALDEDVESPPVIFRPVPCTWRKVWSSGRWR